MKLAMHNISAGYGSRTVISEISASVYSGEIVCLLGPNGSGKTTLFKAILGLIPSRGDIHFDERSAWTFTTRERARALAYVPQIHIPPFPFNAIDIVLMGRTPFIGAFSVPSPHDRREAARVMNLLHIGHLADRNYAQISGGERQLVLIARALAQSPQFLIMDEPTLHLDFGNQIRTLNLIRQLATGNMGVIITTHVPDHAFACATRVIALLDGRIAADGPPKEVLSRELLKRMYGIDVDIISVAEGRFLCVPAMGGAM
jgi:ABC-type cobalamin/Fe3+-siderophores transport system ATPase subunit